MNIAFCINDAYADKVAVVMVSVLHNHPKDKIDFYIFSSDFTEASLERLQKLKRKYKNFTLTGINVPQDKFEQLSLNIDYISMETYYRYIIADLVPQLDKILYLDADLVVCQNLSKLYETDLNGFYLAGVNDLFIQHQNYRSKIGFSESQPYVNAGVLLMNLALMRKDKISEKFIETTKKMQGIIQYQDQDVINIVCQNKIKLMDSIYNFASENAVYEKEKLKNAYVIHYTGPKKPWQSKRSKRGKIWRKYHQLSQYVIDRKISVNLFAEEFFGGGYVGCIFWVQRYITKYFPDKSTEFDVFLEKGEKTLWAS